MSGDQSGVTTHYFLPWRGEFGQMLMHQVRWFHHEAGRLQGDKVMCCRKGDEALYPRADRFDYDWEQVADVEKKTSLLKSEANLAYLQEVGYRISLSNPTAQLHLAPKRWAIDRTLIFKPQPKTPVPDLKVDIVVCPRFRKHGAHRNFAHWPAVIDGLLAAGLRVGLAGMKETSVDHPAVPEEMKGWNHDPLDWTLHLMNAAKLVLATDAGLAHLAVLNQSPLYVIYDQPGREAGKPEWPWALPHMRGYATTFCEPLPLGWNQPAWVIRQTIGYFLQRGLLGGGR